MSSIPRLVRPAGVRHHRVQSWTKLDDQTMHVRNGIRDADPRPESAVGSRALQGAAFLPPLAFGRR